PYNLASKLKPFDHDLVDKEWRKKAHQVLAETDGVSLAKAVKYPAVYGRFIGDDDLKNLSLGLVSSLTRYHGTAMGMFACSPRLGAASATDAIDVLAAVEMIESLVEVVKETGDYALMDLLERIVFNVIPSATFDDCSAVQDLVLVNQIEASVQRKLPYAEEDNAFYTKKLTRGSVAVLSAYPLYLQTACMIKNDEINFLTYTPCKMDIRVAGCHMTVTERTGYPFRNTVAFRVDSVDGEPEVKINFRAPKHTTIQLISGGQVVASGTKQISVKCVLKTGSTFMIKMDIPLVAEETRRGCISLYKGNLLMSEKVPADIKVSAEDRRVFYINFVKRFSVSPILAKKASGGERTLFEPEHTVVHEIAERPFSFDVPPFELLIRSKNVSNWDYDVNGFAEIPKKPDYSEESLERTYIPVGCTLLRIAEFPKCLK
ncbi:MAG: glycoside hydrolase family 127 protein, partial [Clostridia bacterium]|nr:glycoside hydrolase family 127 protein [Clostridia bacterium]